MEQRPKFDSLEFQPHVAWGSLILSSLPAGFFRRILDLLRESHYPDPQLKRPRLQPPRIACRTGLAAITISSKTADELGS